MARGRSVRRSRGSDSGKGKEVGSWPLIYVHPLTVSKEDVVKYRKLFLDAVSWYSQDLVGRLVQPSSKEFLPYVNDPDYSLLPDLKKRIESGDEVPSGKMNNLLGAIVDGYHSHLKELGRASWSREDTIQRQLTQVDEITKNSVIKAKR